jgi:hypothetical protein
MGRPLNKKLFANTNFANQGIGGEGVASVTIGGSWANFADATTTVTFSAPQIAGGVTATGTATIVEGAVTAVVVTNSGSGYTSAPTVTIADSDVGAETTGTATAVLTTSRQNGIVCQAITAGSTNRTSGNDIVKQVASKRFKVRTQDGTADCTLKASTPTAAGEMAIVATDSDSGTYFVTKITARRVTITRGTGTQFATGAQVPWTFDTAAEGVSVKIPNA